MKRFIIAISALLLLTACAFAQSERDRGWFIGAGAGMNIGIDGFHGNGRDNSKTGAGTAGDFYIGKFFGDVTGFRAGYQGFGVSDKYTEYGTYNLSYAHADLLFRVLEPVVPYVHAGYMAVDKGSAAAGAGIMFPIQVSRRVSIVPDFKATMTEGRIFPEKQHGLSSVMSGTLGLRIALGKTSSRRRVEAPVHIDTPPVAAPVAEEPVAEEEHTCCQEAEPVKEPEATVIPERVVAPLPEADTVLFLFQSKELTDEAKQTLDGWAAYLADHPEETVRIEGHTCSIGAEWFNNILSEDRADAVRKYLESKGIEASRITVKGYGESRPAESNEHPWTRARNRRAVIVVHP